MWGIALLMFAVAALFALLAVSPRKYWWRYASKFYKNPHAVEPSDRAYALESVGGGIAAVWFVIMGIWTLTIETPQQAEARREQARAECQEIMSDLREVYEEEDLAAVRRRAGELDVEIDVREPPRPLEMPSGAMGEALERQLGDQRVAVSKDREYLGTLGGFGGFSC